LNRAPKTTDRQSSKFVCHQQEYRVFLFWRSLLDAKNVCIADIDETGSFGLLPGYVSVWVPETQSTDADHILESFRLDDPDPAPDADLSIPDGAAPA